MDFKHIVSFCTIVEEGQISRAANVLHISQPPLSKRLIELEEEIGAQLIYRANGRWEVTAEGRALYNRSREIIQRLESLKDDVKCDTGQPRGTIKLGITHTCLGFYFNIFSKAMNRYPDIHWELLIADPNVVETNLQNRTINFAILLKPLLNSNYVMRDLPSMRYMAVFPECIKAPGNSYISLRELGRFPLMLSHRWQGFPQRYMNLINLFHKAGVEPNVVLRTSVDAFLLMGVLNNLPAVAILPESELGAKDIRHLQIRKIDSEDLALEPVVVYRDDIYVSPVIQIALDILAENTGS